MIINGVFYIIKSMNNEKKIYIKQERINAILFNRHPWVFSGAVKEADKNLEQGDVALVCDTKGKPFAQAAYNPKSDITLRIITRDVSVDIDRQWFLNRIKKTALLKEKLLDLEALKEENKNYRAVFSDSDSIPGLVIDRFGLVFVLQFQTFFADKRRDMWVLIIKELWKPSCIYERSDAEVRKKEGLKDKPCGVLYGKIEKPFIIEDDGFKTVMDIEEGQKTGYFLDLRQARHSIEHWVKALGIKYVQNYFAYTGTLSLYAVRGGADRVEHIDISEKANETAEISAKLNKVEDKVNVLTEDCFKYLEKTKNESVDAVILDPPSFVKTKDKINNAVAAYERLNELGLRKVKPGGLLFTFCCSSYISEEMFAKILFKASNKAGAKLMVIEKFSHTQDHLWSLDFPQGRYFQGWVLLKGDMGHLP